MDSTTLNNEQMAFVAARTFAKLWMPRGQRESLQSFQKFCYELLRSTQVAMPIVMLTLLYVSKFKQRFPGLHGGNGSEYRMFVVALMLASKYLEDNTFTTQTWSEVSHLPAKELTIMQREFLTALDHRLHVPESEYNAWIARLQTIVLDNNKGCYNITLGSPQMSEQCSSVDLQVVPSPVATQLHELPAMEMLTPPPAKRVRQAAASVSYPVYYVSGANNRVRSVVEPFGMPSHSVAALTPLYTPPAANVGFAHSEFTFNAPSSFSAVAQPSMFFQQQQAQHPLFSAADLGYSASATVLPPVSIPAQQSSYPAIQRQQQQQQQFGVRAASSAGIYSGNNLGVGFFDNSSKASLSAPSVNSMSNTNLFAHFQQQQQQSVVPRASGDAAAALAAQYPSLYFSASTLGFVSGATSAFPIYTYGA